MTKSIKSNAKSKFTCLHEGNTEDMFIFHDPKTKNVKIQSQTYETMIYIHVYIS